MRTLIDINSLPRKDLYKRYRDFEEPFFGISTDVVCTNAYEFSRKNNYSFFLYYLYLTLEAVNRTLPFRYRIEGKELYLYDAIDAFTTIDQDDGTFGFSLISYFENINLFMEKSQSEINDLRLSGHPLSKVERQNIIRFSTLPWLKFTSVSHPRQFMQRDSIPRIVFGKMFEDRGEKKIPVSVHVHHALVDGLHVGEFIDRLEGLMNRK